MSSETEQQLLEKTNRIILLFDFYEELLTDRQRTYMQYYFHDDYSLGEIADEFAVSRQAVYDQLKRTKELLESYERKLGLCDAYERRQGLLVILLDEVKKLPEWATAQQERMQDLVARIQEIEG